MDAKGFACDLGPRVGVDDLPRIDCMAVRRQGQPRLQGGQGPLGYGSELWLGKKPFDVFPVDQAFVPADHGRGDPLCHPWSGLRATQMAWQDRVGVPDNIAQKDASALKNFVPEQAPKGSKEQDVGIDVEAERFWFREERIEELHPPD